MERPHFPSDIEPEQFERVRPLLEGARRRTRPRKHDLFDVFNAVLYFLHSGAAWRSLPTGFPPWRTVHEYFTQWTEARPGQLSLLETVLLELGMQDSVDRVRMLLRR